MRRAVIAGNWKMFKKLNEADAFASEFVKNVRGVADRDIIICPPFVYLQRLVEAFKGSSVKIGAQNVFWEDQGAYTGEVSAPMLKSLEVTYVIIGHSERRQYFAETDETVNRRLIAALKGDLRPIVCIGETLTERETGNILAVLETQVRNGLKGLSVAQASNLIIAYEPMWAIGTGKTATPEIAQEAHAHIRKILAAQFGAEASEKTIIQYGGSVKPDNIDALMAQKDIDGALVGGASLDGASFERIVKFRG